MFPQVGHFSQHDISMGDDQLLTRAGKEPKIGWFLRPSETVQIRYTIITLEVKADEAEWIRSR